MSNNKEILLVGHWSFHMYEESFAKGLTRAGCNVIKFSLSKYSLKFHFLNYYLNLFKIRKINSDIQLQLKSSKANYLFLWNDVPVFPKTLKIAKLYGVKVVTYTNDDPFKSRSILQTRNIRNLYSFYWYRKFIKFSDVNFVYRAINLQEIEKFAPKSKNFILMPYFVPDVHYPLNFSLRDCKRDVIFIGHYEDDQRVEYINYLLEKGIDIQIFGAGWEKAKDLIINGSLKDIKVMEKHNYTLELSRSRICLCFLSKLNRDEYTRRCFEIPAMKKILVSEYSHALNKIYRDGEEAVYFKSKEDLLKKVKDLLSNPREIDRIAENGYKKCLNEGFDVYSISRDFIRKVDEVL